MSTPLILALLAFAAAFLFALIVGGWREAIEAAWPKNAVATEGPQVERVSLLVPARNAARTLTALLQDLHAQQWPKEALEVIVVDDGSEDGTAEQVREMGKRWPGLVLLKAEGKGKKDAISQGVRRAQGEWVLLTDADARCGPLRVQRIMQHVVGSALDLLLLPVETRAHGGAIQQLQADEQTALLGVGAGTALQGGAVLANGANLAFRRSAFLAVGGYAGDTWASGDDMFLLQRMRKAGRQVGYLLHPDVLVTVDAEPTFAGFWSQRLRWAGKMRAMSGPGPWGALAGSMLPWFLLYTSCSFSLEEMMVQRPLAILFLLSAAWLLWLLPLLALARTARRFLRASTDTAPLRWSDGSSLLSLLAFSLYAPVVALASLFVRPRWKGRKTGSPTRERGA